MKMKSRILMLVVLLAAAAGAQAQRIDHIIFFGDSLSDAGNNFIYTGASSRQPFDFGPPAWSYDIGGHHFSNGNTWAERLATSLHLPASGSPALRAPGVFTNYAVGDARSRPNAPSFPAFDLSTQVNRFLTDFNGQVPANALVVIWIGGNDIDDALNALFVDPSGQTSVQILQAALQAIQTNIGILYGAGARMFLIANVPSFANTPYVRFLGAYVNPVIPSLADALAAFYNQYVAQITTAAPFLLPTDPVHPLQFVRLFDTDALLNQILASPAAYGFTNVTGRCTTPGVIGNAICSTPNRYLFWDGIHPTTAAHAIIANAALQLLPPQ